jgi:hypothetical protein
MSLLSRRSVLAIPAVVDVALHSRSTPVGAKALAARHKLPPRHLETLFQGLVHAKILKGVRGPRGGTLLQRCLGGWILRDAGGKRFRFSCRGADHAFQTSFERQAAHSPSASSGRELARI